MKKTYCDRCGREMEQNSNILLRKEISKTTLEDYFDLCDICRDALFGWLNCKPIKQENPFKIADKPAKKMLPAWATIKQLAAIFCQPERRMNRLMSKTEASRRKAKEGLNWCYEYQITQETYDYLTSKLS